MSAEKRAKTETALYERRSRSELMPLLMSEEHDNLARISYQLLCELWITRDRLAVLEQVLVEKDLISNEDVENFHPEGEFAEKLELMRDHMIENVAGAPFSGELTVEDLKARGERIRKFSGS